MPFNSSGIFERLYSWVADRDNNIPIRADRMDAEMNSLKDAVNAITANDVPQRGPVRGVAGSADMPGYGFEGDANTGMYRAGADEVGISAGGATILRAGVSRVTFSVPLAAASGALTAEGDATVTGTLTANTLTTESNTTVTGALEVGGSTTLTGTLDAEGDATVTGTLTANTLTANTLTVDTLEVNGNPAITTGSDVLASSIRFVPVAGIPATNVQDAIAGVNANVNPPGAYALIIAGI